ncbi:MAG: META domain-containing protein [Paludibacteraceae bacterium]|nr:META domain-containing protein [Paludibacteraceae bacterium]
MHTKKIVIFLLLTTLLLGCSSKRTVATYENPSLLDKVWGIVSVQGVKIEYKNQADVAYFTFTSDKKVHGYAGCNNYNASFSAEEDKMTIQEIAITKKACPEYQLEKKILNGMAMVAKFYVRNKTLKLFDENGKELFNCVLVEEEKLP